MFVLFLLAIRNVFRAISMFLVCFFALIFGIVFYFIPSISNIINRFVCNAIIKILNVQVNIIGNVPHKRAFLLVANHLSWVDFIVLNSNQSVSFVAKEELLHMPIIGWLARLSCIFTHRTRKTTNMNSQVIANYLVSGYSVAMFPESTTTSGNLIPFHSSMFSAASTASKILQSEVLVQPISIIYTKYNGLPINTKIMSDFAWCSGRSLLSRVMDLVFSRGLTEVYLVYHKPIVFDTHTDRKEVATACENIIRLTLSNYRKYGRAALV